MKLWDFRQMAEIQTMEGFDEVIMSAAWSFSGGLIGIATRDGFLRYYDPRSKSGCAGVRPSPFLVSHANSVFRLFAGGQD